MNYSINTTTKEEREDLVKKAFIISTSGADAPTKEAVETVKEYLKGNKELDEVQKEIIERYRKV